MADSLSIALPLRSIREHLGLSRNSLSQGICTQTHIDHIEKGRKAPSLDLMVKLAGRMSCEVSDLLSIPSEARLAQIKADFDEAKAAKSRAAADAVQEAGAGT